MSVLDQIFGPEEYSEPELKQILTSFRSIERSKHSMLLRSGEIASHYWYLEQGVARSYAVNPRGDDITTQFFTSGDLVIDWPSFLLKQPTQECIETLADCRLWQIDFATFETLFHSIPAFRETGRGRLVQSYFALKRNSVALIADRAEERYRRLVKDKPQLLENVPLKHIASFLGVTAPSLSRIRRQLVDTNSRSKKP